MDNVNLLILKEETLKVFRFYFLALLLICAVPVFAQEATASEGTPEQGEAATSAQEAPAEAAQQEEKAADDVKANAEKAQEELEAETAEKKEETPAEEAPAKEDEPAKEEAPAEEGQSDLEAELAAQADESDSAELAKAEEEKKEEQPKLTVGINNGFSHGFAKERKSFGYTLNIFASYNLPLDFALSVDVGLRESYRYGMSVAYASEDGTSSTNGLSASKFDGTPLNIGLSKGFPIVAGIMGSVGISASIPFTSKEMWDQYKIRTILGVDLGLAKNFNVAKDTTLGLSFGFSYAKTFASEDYAWDDYSNEPLGANQNHDISLALSLGLGYKGFGFKLSGGYSIGTDYHMDVSKYYYDDWKKEGTVSDSNWYYLFSFGATASYSIKGFVFALGVRTNAPEFDNGNYEGFSELPGDPDVKNGSTNYPFKAKYTTVFANIGYSYSF